MAFSQNQKRSIKIQSINCMCYSKKTVIRYD